jgi:hypothetical protein
MMEMDIINKTTINTIRMDMHKITIKIKINMIKIIINMRDKSMRRTSTMIIINRTRMWISEQIKIILL